MSTPTEHRGILVGVDGSAPAKVATDWAAREAAARGLPLTLLYVVSPGLLMWSEFAIPPGYGQWEQERAAEIVQDAVAVATAAGGEGLQVRTELRTGPTVIALVQASEGATMTVVGSHGRGALGRALLGSVSSSLVRHAHCPVAVIRDEDLAAATPSSAPVVVGIDGSPASAAAAAIAFDEADRRGVELVAVHAISDGDLIELPRGDWEMLERRGSQVLGERLAGWQEQYPDVSVRREVVWSHPARALIKESERAQLVVVGSRGRGGFTGMLIGSVAAAVVQAVRTPVIVAR